MNNNYIILILIIIIIYLIYKNYKNSIKEKFESTNTSDNTFPIKVKNSDISGLGVFSTREIKKGEIIEECPCIEDDENNFDGVVRDYVFSSNNKGKSVVAFGYCSLYNHQEDFDVQWSVEDGKKVVLKAIKDIPINKEIYIHYGDTYWKTRDIEKK